MGPSLPPMRVPFSARGIISGHNGERKTNGNPKHQRRGGGGAVQFWNPTPAALARVAGLGEGEGSSFSCCVGHL